SIATSAGYTNSALFSSFAAYTMVSGRILPMYQVFVWLVLIAIIGVLFAFPLKKRFINDEQLPFPEGMAAGAVMYSLPGSGEKEGGPFQGQGAGGVRGRGRRRRAFPRRDADARPLRGEELPSPLGRPPLRRGRAGPLAPGPGPHPPPHGRRAARAHRAVGRQR